MSDKVTVCYYNKSNQNALTDFNTPCLFILNGLVSGPMPVPKGLSKMVQMYGIEPNICGNIYDLSLWPRKYANIANNLSNRFCPKKKNIFVMMTQLACHSYFSRYIEHLFNETILPRITDETGKALPVEVAQKNLRNIVFFSHCYGSRLALSLDKMLFDKLHALNYSSDQIIQLQQQLCFILESPSFIFGNHYATHISFISMADQTVGFKYLFHTNNNSVTCYNKSHIISVPRMYNEQTPMFKEHSRWNMLITDDMSCNGKNMINIRQQVLFKALTVKHIDSTESLIKDFEYNSDIQTSKLFEFLDTNKNMELKNFAFSGVCILIRELHKLPFFKQK